MIIYIKSRIDPDQLLSIAIKKPSSNPITRTDFCKESEPLQLAYMNRLYKKTFPPHKHITRKMDACNSITQEAWIVINGTVAVSYYDTDNTLLETVQLNAGDCTITFAGGHGYEIIEDETCIYELKTGPYLGRELDKELI